MSDYLRRYPSSLGDPGIWGDIWGELKRLPGEIKKIDVKDVEKLGSIVAAFQAGKKGGKGAGGPPPVQYQFLPLSPVTGVSMSTLLFMAGGLGLGLYLLLRK